jgi:predicted nucleic acid-binding protein
LAAFLDTNVLLYSISGRPEEAAKRARAREILDRRDCVLSVQTLQEFHHQATRRSRKDAISHDDAVSLILSWRRFRVEENSLQLLLAALDLTARGNTSLWDNLILAAARAAGCDTLYTEDMQHGRVVDGVSVVNPFR